MRLLIPDAEMCGYDPYGPSHAAGTSATLILEMEVRSRGYVIQD